VKRFRGGLVFKAHRLVYHSTPGSRVIKKKEEDLRGRVDGVEAVEHMAHDLVAGANWFNLKQSNQ